MRGLTAVLLAAGFAASSSCGKEAPLSENKENKKEVVEVAAEMGSGDDNLVVTMRLPDWLVSHVAGKVLADTSGGGGHGTPVPVPTPQPIKIPDVEIYILVRDSVAVQKLGLVVLENGLAQGAFNVGLGEKTVQAFYVKYGEILYHSDVILLFLEKGKVYKINFSMGQVAFDNILVSATWDTTAADTVVVSR